MQKHRVNHLLQLLGVLGMTIIAGLRLSGCGSIEKTSPVASGLKKQSLWFQLDKNKCMNRIYL